MIEPAAVESLKAAVEGMHGGTARLAQAVPVQESFEGAPVWEGVVHVFDLDGNPTAQTNLDTIATAVRFGRRLGKTVIVVADRPGFWVNRILAPYFVEAGHLILEGIPIDVIDRAMVKYGFPVGYRCDRRR